MQKLIPACLMLAVVPLAWGHAVLLQASPQAEATVSGPVVPVSLRFNSRIDAKRSRLAFVEKGREEVLEVRPQTSPDTIQSSIKNAHSGPYRIRWQVLASDGHITRGEIVFQVK